MAVFQRPRIQSVAFTHTGLKRGHNEDSILAMPEHRLWAVADGMGGHEKGEVASAIVVEKLDACTRAGQAAEQALREAHASITELGEADKSNLGSTAIVLSLDETAAQFELAWVGDSRAYRVRDKRMEQLSADHTLVAELQRAGVINAEEAERHPEKNALSRAVGRANPGELEVEVQRGDVADGDLFLLCSDGLTTCVSEDDILAQLTGFWSLPYKARKLIDAALRGGGPDNISVVLIHVIARDDST